MNNAGATSSSPIEEDNPQENNLNIDELKVENEKLKTELDRLKDEQLPKDIEFNNLCDDYNKAKEDCDKLTGDNENLK